MNPFEKGEVRVPDAQWPWWFRWLSWLFGPAFPEAAKPAVPVGPGGYAQPVAAPMPWPWPYRPVAGAVPAAAPSFGPPRVGSVARKPFATEPAPADGDEASRPPGGPAAGSGRGIFIALILIIIFFYFSSILNTPAGIGGSW